MSVLDKINGFWLQVNYFRGKVKHKLRTMLLNNSLPEETDPILNLLSKTKRREYIDSSQGSLIRLLKLGTPEEKKRQTRRGIIKGTLISLEKAQKSDRDNRMENQMYAESIFVSLQNNIRIEFEPLDPLNWFPCYNEDTDAIYLCNKRYYAFESFWSSLTHELTYKINYHNKDERQSGVYMELLDKLCMNGLLIHSPDIKKILLEERQ